MSANLIYDTINVGIRVRVPMGASIKTLQQNLFN